VINPYAPRVIKDLPDGRRVWVQRRLYNTQIIIGAPEAPYYDNAW